MNTRPFWLAVPVAGAVLVLSGCGLTTSSSADAANATVPGPSTRACGPSVEQTVDDDLSGLYYNLERLEGR